MFSVFEVVILYEKNKDNIEILSWRPDECGNFIHEINLGQCRDIVHLRKLIKIPDRPRKFKNCNLIVYGSSNPPFSISNRHGDISGGIAFKLITDISTYLNFEIRKWDSRTFKRKDFIGFDYNPHDFLNPLIYCVPYYSERFTWFVPRAESQPQWSSVTRVFKTDTWVCMLVALVIVSIFLKLTSFLEFGDISKCLLCVWGMFLSISVESDSHSDKIRVVFCSWIVFSIAYTTVFQAFMTSFFIDPGRQHQLDSLEELQQSNLTISTATFENSEWNLNMNRSTIFVFFNANYHMLQFAFSDSTIAALTSEESLLYNFRQLCVLNRTVLFYKFLNNDISMHRTLKMYVTSPFIPVFNKIIRSLVEAGIVERMVYNIVDPTGVYRGYTMDDKSLDNYNPLTTFHVLSPVIYLMLGLNLSFIVLVAELLVSKIRKIYY